MPRNLTPAMIAQLTGQLVRPALFVKIAFDNEVVCLWSGIGTITPQVPGIVTMPVYGPNSPAAYGNIVNGGVGWTNIFYIGSNTNFVTVTLPSGSGQISEFALGAQFNFSIPAGQTIAGIEVSFNASQSNPTGRFNVFLQETNSLYGAERIVSAGPTPSRVVVGGSGDLWGSSQDAATIDNNLWGCAIEAFNLGAGANSFQINGLTIKVYLAGAGGPVTTFPYGQSWTGMGWLGQIPTIPEITDVVAQNITLTLSGIPVELVTDAINYVRQNSSATVWFGCLDQNNNVIGDPTQIFQGHLDVPTITEGGSTCTISITGENPLIDLNRAPNRRFTDTDQQLDFSGDLGFAAVGSLQGLYLGWPLYPLVPGGGVGP